MEEFEGSSTVAAVPVDVSRPRLLWGLAILFYGVGDTATTLLGLQTAGIAEAGPLARLAMAHAGHAGFFGLKAAFIGGCFAAWYVLDTSSRVAIPLALVVAGVLITAWNIVMLLI